MADDRRSNRFFFNIRHNRLVIDREGVLATSRLEARRQALQMAGKMLADQGTANWRGDDWQMFVTDENDRIAFTISIKVQDR